MPKIDFLIIGAQKGGTTSLFEYMRRHPRIHMPPKKEIEFFNRDHAFRRGLDWYLANVTRGAPSDAVCGEASTYYMSGCPGDIAGDERREPQGDLRDNESLEEVIPRRIKQFFPDVKLICVLRDPVARAYSAYRMMALEQIESRSFDEAIDQLLVSSALDRARAVPTMTNGYVVMGEYCRVLAGFLRIFPREQLIVVFSDDLAELPAETLASVFEFVGVEADFVPDNLDSRYREAAVKERIPGLHLVRWQANLARVRPARVLWHALPEHVRSGLDDVTYRARMWNARRGEMGDDMSPAVRERLRVHFRSDSQGLNDLLARDTPWLATWAQSSAGEPSSVASIDL
jgi:Sulfotransferase domain